MKHYGAIRKFLQVSVLLVITSSSVITANYFNDFVDYIKNKGYEDIVKPTLVGIAAGAAPQIVDKCASNKLACEIKNLDKPAVIASSVYYLNKEKGGCTQLTFFYAGYILSHLAPSLVK